jgi:alpha-beta hydrolase superfamily lysophospholipase
MHSETFTFKADDGHPLFVYRWSPGTASLGVPRAVVHIAHGMSEHAGRYAVLADTLTSSQYIVYANDHRGHGRSATSTEDLGFFGARRGVRRVVQDIEELVALERKEHIGLPIILLGHSLGAFLAHLFLIEHASAVRAAVLSGSSGKPNALATLGWIIAVAERWRLGVRGRSRLLNRLSFGQYNRSFEPARTPFDWLSRDTGEVDRYIADSCCGFNCTISLWSDLLRELLTAFRADAIAKIPRDIALYVFSGELDPVGGNTKCVRHLLSAYRAAGLQNITERFYPGGRHEMLNETNRLEVMQDLVAWLDRAAAT